MAYTVTFGRGCVRGRSGSIDMTEMQRRDEALAAAISDMQSQWRRDLSDMAALAHERWPIAEASAQPLDWLINDMLLYAQRHAKSELVQQVSALKRRTIGYRQRISGFVATCRVAQSAPIGMAIAKLGRGCGRSSRHGLRTKPRSSVALRRVPAPRRV